MRSDEGVKRQTPDSCETCAMHCLELRREPEDHIFERFALMVMQQSSKTSQQFWDGPFFGKDESRMATMDRFPLLGEREKVLGIEANQCSALGCCKGQLLVIRLP